MKRKGTLITLIVIGVSFILEVRYIWQRSTRSNYLPVRASSNGSVVKKTVATGSIVPKEKYLSEQIFLGY